MAATREQSEKTARKAQRRSSAAKAHRTGRRVAKGTVEPPVEAADSEDAMEELNAAGDDAAADREAQAAATSAENDAAENDNSASADAKKKKKKTEDKASFLAMYFREMSSLEVLKPEQEFEAARDIETLEVSIWVQLLTYAPAVEYVIKLAETCMENSLPEFEAVREAAVDLRKSSSKAKQARLVGAAQDAAEKLRALDQDRQYLDVVLGDLSRIKRQIPGRVMADRLPFSPKSKAFNSYMQRVESADKAAAVARNEFVKANLRLVVSIARRFNHGRMALADLIQEGNIGLMKAVERYDYRRGFRFSTYASWWIRHAISRALADKGREVRLPVHMIDAYHRLSKAKRELTAKLGRNPTIEELSEKTDLPPAKIEKMRTYLVDQSFSLDRPVNDEDGRHFVEFLQDPVSRENHPVDALSTEAMTKEVKTLLLDLKPIEADILKQRFGLDDDRELTLKEIGEKYNLSRERIRQLQEQALGKMRRALARKQML